jgi:hypothetical protein
MTDFSDLRSRPDRTVNIFEDEEHRTGVESFDGTPRRRPDADARAVSAAAAATVRPAPAEHPPLGRLGERRDSHRCDSRFTDGPWA